MPRRPGSFAARVSAWQRRHGRRDLPWQGTRDPYRIWVSEIMLQQTQVATVIPYFGRFMARFPDIETLARAPEEEVMRHWSGLGYYARARNLHRGAQAVMARHGGRFPATAAEVEALPGIGRSTAAAILAFSTGARLAILDGNVKRVLARHFGVEGAADSASVLRELWALAESLLPTRSIEPYTQGLMDLGATVCARSRPDCAACPVRDTCVALRDGRVAELPGRRPARAARVREVAMLVVVSGGEVLVEKRPGSGIWGGLWSLPEAPASVDPVAHAAKALGIRAAGAEALPPFRHAFTHFTLAVTPWLLRAGRKAARAREPSGLTWLALDEVRSAALPAPVKRLLAGLASPGA